MGTRLLGRNVQLPGAEQQTESDDVGEIEGWTLGLVEGQAAGGRGREGKEAITYTFVACRDAIRIHGVDMGLGRYPFP